MVQADVWGPRLHLTRRGDFDQLERAYLGLPIELRHQVRSSLSILSLLDARPGMPDPHPHRPAVDALLRRLEPQ